MPWMDDSQSSGVNTDSVWLRFPQQIKNVGDKTEARMRVIAGDPADPGVPLGVWVHWLQGKPFNCNGPLPCPVCAARKEVSVDRQKTEFPMRSKQFFNVLVDDNGKPAVKVYSFGFGVSKDLKSFSEKYGDLRKYDITVRKEQVGRLPMNVDYSVFFEGFSELNDDQKEAAQSLHDLSQFIKAAPIDDLKQVAKGIVPEPHAQKEVTTDDMERAHLIGELRKKIPADLDLKNFGIYEDTSLDKIEALLKSLRGE